MTINLLFLDKPFLLPSQQRQGLMGQFLENYYIFDCLKFIYWCEVFTENTWIKQEYFSANKELSFQLTYLRTSYRNGREQWNQV